MEGKAFQAKGTAHATAPRHEGAQVTQGTEEGSTAYKGESICDSGQNRGS